MKLKQMLDEKVIEILSHNSKLKNTSNPLMYVLNPLKFLSGEEKKTAEKALTDLAHLAYMLEYMEFKDKKFYDALIRNFKKGQKEAEIDIYELEQKFPVIKELNKALSVYKVKDIYKRP